MPVASVSPSVDRYRFVVGGFVAWAFFSSAAGLSVISPVLPLIREDYGINHTAAGLLVGAASVVWGIFGIPGALLVGRLGSKRTFTLAWLLTSLSALVALSPGFEELLALRVLYGLGLATMVPATGSLFMQWFRPSELTAATGVSFLFVTLGMVVSVATAAPLAEAFGWQRAVGLYGAIGLAGTAAWSIWGRARYEARDGTFSLGFREIRSLLTGRFVLVIAVANAACWAHYMELSAWLPTFYNETRDITLTRAGFITSLMPLAGIFGLAIGTILPLRSVSPRTLLFVAGATAGVGGLGSFLVDNDGVTYACVMLLGMGYWLSNPTIFGLPASLPGMTPERLAYVWGWYATLSGLSAFVSPLAVGALRDATGTFVPGFLVFGVAAWLLFASGIILPEAGRGQRAGPRGTLSTAPAQD